MKKIKNEINEFSEWCYCPNNPGVLRRIVGFDDEGAPVIEERNVTDIDHKPEEQTSTEVEP